MRDTRTHTTLIHNIKHYKQAYAAIQAEEIQKTNNAELEWNVLQKKHEE